MTGDEVYGLHPGLRAFLQSRGMSYVGPDRGSVGRLRRIVSLLGPLGPGRSPQIAVCGVLSFP